MARLASKTEKVYIEICRCERAGLSRAEAGEALGAPISEYRWKQALAWHYNQISVRSEIESVYNALKQTQELKRDAQAFFRIQRTTVMMKSKGVNVRDIEMLIARELEYVDRIRELAQQVVDEAEVVGDAEEDAIGDLPEWIAELEGP